MLSLFRKRTALVAVLSCAAVLPWSVQAQEEPAPATEDVAPADAAPAEGTPADGVAGQSAPLDTIPVPQDEAKGDVTQLDAIEVTGSRIKRTDFEGPSPIAIIGRQEIDKLGYTTVKDVLGNLSYNAGGSFDAGQSFSFARGTQSIDLRGFGAGRTLILLDGRRLPVFPQGLGGTNAFVDLSTIPASLIERVEILLDGASAIYGSDAISGVVNIITRKNFAGTMVTGRLSTTSGGGAGAQRLQILKGFTSGETAFQLVAEMTDQQKLLFTDRDYSSSDFLKGGNGSSFGSNFIADGADGIPGTDDDEIMPDPNCEQTLGRGGVSTPTRCRFDRSKFREWIPDSNKGSIYLRGDSKLGALDSFFRLGYYRGTQSVHLEHNPFQGGESGAFTANRIYPNSAFPDCGGSELLPGVPDPTDPGAPCPGYVPDGAPNDPTGMDGQGGYFNRRLVEFGQRGQDLVTESMNGVFGLSGYWGDFNWDAGISQNVVRITAASPTVLSSVLDNEVSNNGLDLFATIPDDIVRRASHTSFEKGISRNRALDGTIGGPAYFSLPGGEVRFATHLDLVDESYSDMFDAVTTNGDVFDGGSGGGGDRKLVGLGLELNLPILDSLEAGIAGRYDKYIDDSQVGGHFSPSAKLGYRPLDSVLLRASYGQSFRAPDLQRLFGATTAGFETVIDSVACKNAGGTNGTPVDPANANDPCLPIQSVPTITGSNPDLTEETGTNMNFGASWEAMEDLNFTLDYYQIRVEDLVTSLSGQQTLDACANTGQFCENITRDPNGNTLGTPSAGGSNQALITTRAVNVASQEIHGYDFRTSYTFRFTEWGDLRTEGNWSHLTSVKVRSTPDGPEVQQLKNQDYLVVPQDRQNVTADWSISHYGATLRADRVGEYAGGQAGLNPPKDQFVKPFLTFGLQLRNEFATAGTLRLGIDNLFNKEMSVDPSFAPGTPGVQNQYLGESTSFYSNPLGRQMYVQYEYTF